MLNDLRFACRQLLKHPGTSLAAALALAFGIGFVTLQFGMVNCLLLRPLPFEDSHRLYLLERLDRKSQQKHAFSVLEWPTLQTDTRSFEEIAACSEYDHFELAGSDLSAQRYLSLDNFLRHNPRLDSGKLEKFRSKLLPEGIENWTLVRPRSFSEHMNGGDRWRIWGLLVLGVSILLIACGNVATLLCARGSERRRRLGFEPADRPLQPVVGRRRGGLGAAPAPGGGGAGEDGGRGQCLVSGQ